MATEAAPAVDIADPKHGGTAAYAQGDYPTALSRYERAVKENPSDADALNNLGQVLTRMGRATEAIPLFERALALLSERVGVSLQHGARAR